MVKIIYLVVFVSFVARVTQVAGRPGIGVQAGPGDDPNPADGGEAARTSAVGALLTPP
jgi:hypothetical protein